MTVKRSVANNAVNGLSIMLGLSLLIVSIYIIVRDSKKRNDSSSNTVTRKYDERYDVGVSYREARMDGPIRTRPVRGYRQLGMLVRNMGMGEQERLALFGRRTHVSSTRWNYIAKNQSNGNYIQLTQNGDRCEAVSPGCRELTNGSKINIYGKEYDVFIYD
tara:strand:- start:315 stop:797 length:483 start_codon:yes stop_codon:yes gene_type:complete